MFFPNFHQSAFGLDISNHSLKAVSLKKTNKTFTLCAYNDISVPSGLIVNGEIKDQVAAAELVKKVIKGTDGLGLQTKDVIACLPEIATFIKVIAIPYAPEDQLQGAIEKEMKQHLPYSMEEIYWDWQIVCPESKKNDIIEVLVGAAPKKIVDAYTAMLEKAGLTVVGLEIEGAAIARSLIKENDQEGKIILDFGATRSSLIVYDRGCVQFTVSLPMAGEKITKTIADTLKLTPRQAEKAKIVCGLDRKKCRGALKTILFSTTNNLTKKIKSAIDFYQTHFPQGNEIKEIILSGGGANFKKIDATLQEQFKQTIKLGNPLVNIAPSKLAIPGNILISYATAIGLAMGSEEQNIFNLKVNRFSKK